MPRGVNPLRQGFGVLVVVRKAYLRPDEKAVLRYRPRGTGGNTVKKNEVSECDYGISMVFGANDNDILKNEVEDSMIFGIGAHSGSTGNLVKENVVAGSGFFDLFDWSASPPLLNDWIDNVYTTSNFP